MSQIIEVFAGLLSAPLLLLLFRVIGVLQLPLLRGWNRSFEVLAFIFAALGGGAALATKQLGKRARWISVFAVALVLVAMFLAYDHIATNPASDRWYDWVRVAGAVSYFGTYLCFGFVTATTLSLLFAHNPAAPSPPAKA